MTATLRKLPAPDEYLSIPPEARAEFETMMGNLRRVSSAFSGSFTTGRALRDAYRVLSQERQRIPAIRAAMMKGDG